MRQLAASILVVLLVVPTAWAEPFSAGVVMAGVTTAETTAPPDPDPATYETVVVLGDLQGFTRSYWQDEPAVGTRWDDFVDTITWIVDNKETENIRLVLGVGDIIDAGTPLPTGANGGALNTNLECIGENQRDGTTEDYIFDYQATNTECLGVTSSDEGLCEAFGSSSTHCFWYPPASDCVSCWLTYFADVEWDAFELQWQRLASAEITGFLAAGNHDNPGDANLVDRDTEPLGWNQRFGPQYWSDLSATSTNFGWTNPFDLVATLEDPINGNHYAWTTTLAGELVLVVSMPYDGDTDWAEARMAGYPTLPSILLTHHKGQVGSIISDSENLAPNLFMVAAGHIGWPSTGNRKTIVENGAEPERVITIETDYTNTVQVPGGSAQLDVDGDLRDDYITLFRLHDDGDIESVDFSPTVRKEINTTVALGADSRITKQAFDMMPPTPPLPAGLEGRLVTAFDDEGVARPTGGAEPVITDTISGTAANSCAEISIGIKTPGMRVIPADGIYTTCTASDLSTTVDDVWLDMGNNVGFVINGAVTWNANNRNKITGGKFTLGGNYSRLNMENGSDYIVDNLVIENPDWVGMSVTGSDNVTISNTTIRSGQYALYAILQDDSAGSNFVITDNDMIGGTLEHSGSYNGTAVFRFHFKDRVLIAGNRIEVDPLGYALLFRLWAAQADVLVYDNYIEMGLAFASSIWLGSLDPGQVGLIDNIHIHENHLVNRAGDYTEIVQGWDTSAVRPSGCSNVFIEDNIGYSDPAGTFDVGTQSGGNTCSPMTLADNSKLDLSTTWPGGMPGCDVLGCGADHVGVGGSGGGDPDPPPEPGAACLNPPSFNAAARIYCSECGCPPEGCQFDDCEVAGDGWLAGLRSDYPTSVYHAHNQLAEFKLCSQQTTIDTWDWPSLPSPGGYIEFGLEAGGHDMDIRNEMVFPSGLDIHFVGDRYRIENINGGGLTGGGQYVCAGGADIEIDGVCICDENGDPIP